MWIAIKYNCRSYGKKCLITKKKKKTCGKKLLSQGDFTSQIRNRMWKENSQEAVKTARPHLWHVFATLSDIGQNDTGVPYWSKGKLQPHLLATLPTPEHFFVCAYTNIDTQIYKYIWTYLIFCKYVSEITLMVELTTSGLGKRDFSGLVWKLPPGSSFISRERTSWLFDNIAIFSYCGYRGKLLNMSCFLTLWVLKRMSLPVTSS